MSKEVLEYAKIQNQVEIDSILRKISSEAHSLKTQLETIIENIDKKGESADINGSGIVIGQGGSIDNLCGRLKTLKDTKAWLEQLSKE